ncbi:DNA primase [Geomonas sp. Red276]
MCKTYDVVNQRIMELLEQGTIPWRKTWNVETNTPRNMVSKKAYRGINVWLLANSPFGSPYWMTFKQCQDKGGHVRKGERSTPVVFWRWVDKKDSEDADTDETNGKGKVPLLRYYNVFNLDQIDGIPSPPTTETTIITFTPIEKAQQIITNMPHRPEIKHGGNEASYSPRWDRVKMPVPEAFESPEEMYATLYHELIHSTGHASRLGRKGIMDLNLFGSHEYSREEMCAELGASYLSCVAGIEQKTIVNSAAYIQGWLKALKNDKKLLVMAASQGQKSADFILSRSSEEDTED